MYLPPFARLLSLSSASQRIFSPNSLAAGSPHLIAADPTFISSSSASSRLVSKETKEYLEEVWRQWNVPGMAVAALRLRPDSVSDGSVDVEFINFGTAGEHVGPVTEDTLFGIASNSKAFTAAAVASLVDQGKIEWTDKVSTLIPELEFADPVANKYADVLDMLSHKTGLPRHDRSYAFDSLRNVVKRVKSLTSSVEFRKEWQYNNMMFITGAYLVALKSGQDFTDYVSEHFFKALGMHSTTYDPNASQTRESLSTGYHTLKNKTNIELAWTFPTEHEKIQAEAGAGGVISSTRDLVKWVEFLIRQRNATRTDRDDILTPQSVRTMTSALTLMNRLPDHPESSVMHYGTGFMINTYKGVAYIKHGGAIPGFGTQIVWNSQLGIGAIALCNTMMNGNFLTDIATYRVFEDLAGLPHDTDWHARYKAKEKAAESNGSRGRPNATSHGHIAPSLDTNWFGTYEDAGYGNATLCPLLSSVSSFSSSPDSRSRSNIVEACDELYAILENALEGEEAKGAEAIAYWYQPAAFQLPFFYVEKYGYEEEEQAYAVTAVFVAEPTGKRKEHVLVPDPEAGETQARLKFENGKAKMWGVWGPGPEQKSREVKTGYDWSRPEVEFSRV